MSMGVTDPLKRMSISRNSQRLSAVNRDTWSLIETQGASIDQDLVVVNIIGCYGNQQEIEKKNVFYYKLKLSFALVS